MIATTVLGNPSKPMFLLIPKSKMLGKHQIQISFRVEIRVNISNWLVPIEPAWEYFAH